MAQYNAKTLRPLRKITEQIVSGTTTLRSLYKLHNNFARLRLYAGKAPKSSRVAIPYAGGTFHIVAEDEGTAGDGITVNFVEGSGTSTFFIRVAWNAGTRTATITTELGGSLPQDIADKINDGFAPLGAYDEGDNSQQIGAGNYTTAGGEDSVDSSNEPLLQFDKSDFRLLQAPIVNQRYNGGMWYRAEDAHVMVVYG